jgi:uncharacterized membrane protein (UPF0127 family)
VNKVLPADPRLRKLPTVRRFQIIALGVLIMLVLSACERRLASQPRLASASDSTNLTAARPPTRPNPKLATVDLFLGAERLKAEVARRPIEIQTGMMFRETISDDEAMLFVFPQPHQTRFWMKNVTVELSVAYVNPEGKIMEIHPLVPGREETVDASSDNIQFAIETARGWFERHKIGPGTLVRTERGSLQETFFGGPQRRP